MDVEEVRQRLETIQQQDEGRAQWLQKLLTTYNDTVHNLKNAITDVENQNIANRTLLQEKKELQSDLEELQRSIKRSAFVLVLIDADNDGYVFDDKFLLRGTDGGREAALALKSELQQVFYKDKLAIADLPIHVKLYANVDKLAAAMSRNGMHAGSNCLRDFCRGFCQTGGLSEFIDVGDGDDRADHQIKGVLQHFQGNPCCKHIVLGSCHDNGYVCHLDVIESDRHLRDRVTLLKSFQTGRQYVNLKFRTIHLPSLFRTQPFSASALDNSPRTRKSLVTPESSYAAHVGASDASTVESPPLSPTNSTDRSLILVNVRGQRLDRFMKKPSQVAFANYHNKKKELEATGKRGPCNLYYLGGGCTMMASSCQFWHDGFGKADVNVLRWLMRFQRCDNGLQCKFAACFYGHTGSGVTRAGEREVPGK